MTDTTTTELADALIELGHHALTFGTISRTAVYHVDRTTPESDTDHTVMLGWTACALAARCFPALNLGLIAQFALVHDAPEIYAGDTPTLRINATGRIAKARREAAALHRFDIEFSDRLPWFPQVIAEYEQQVLPEARFVRGVDKVMPKIVHMLDDATGLVEQRMYRTELAAVFEAQRVDMMRYVAEFAELMDVRAELVSRVINHPRLADPQPALAATSPA